ncbi:MAG: trypsin-like peptidase domain-containing protein [Candidatus Melainabacteria bacterium]|nr:trypsin-like peptidase domain-containing protein [Candidatus Melainabacteria bacterium]
MAKEIDDDVPIYFSGEELAEEDLVVEPDRTALLKDDAPPAWERYSPAKTLEQAAKEAEKRGEKKIQGKKNFSSATVPPPDHSKKEDSKTDSATLQAVTEQGRAEQSMTLDRFLKLSGRFLKPNLIAVPEEDGQAAAMTSPSSESRHSSEAIQYRRTPRIFVILACVQVFAIGFWIGSFFFPNNKVVTGLRLDEAPATAPGTMVNRLRGDSSIAEVAEKVNPCVVNIDTRPMREPNHVVQPLQGSQQFFQPPQGSNRLPMGYPGQSQASGVIVSTSGHILTSNHVVPTGTEIRVTLNDQREYQGTVVGRDSYTDLAVIKIVASNLPIAKFADFSKTRVGDWAIAIGSPHGFDHTVSVGVVSALGRTVPDFNHHIPMIQTDALIAPGNSGGPLVNIDGEVIGIASAAINRGTVGINFALPADKVSEVTKKLIEKGSIARPFLGLYMEDIDPDRKKSQTLTGHPVMVIVKGVVPKGPAEKVSMVRGDIIVKVNGKPVRSSTEVRSILAELKPGDAMDFEVRRLDSSNVLHKKVILEKYPDNI